VILGVFGAWLIALEIGLLLYQPGKRNRVPIVVARSIAHWSWGFVFILFYKGHVGLNGGFSGVQQYFVLCPKAPPAKFSRELF